MPSHAPTAGALREGDLGRRADTEARAADYALLICRLRQLGVRRPIVVHENRTVLISIGRGGQLRVHRGYAYGSDRVLKAIIRFVNARTRVDRAAAERELQTFSIDSILAPPKERGVPRVSRRDRELLTALARLHARLNFEMFNGKLTKVPFRISDRMRTRLAEVTVHPRAPRLVEITFSRWHLERDGSVEVEKTLLHEMIHQWQAESGLEVDHGTWFRIKAKEVGVVPAAMRVVDHAAAAKVVRRSKGR